MTVACIACSAGWALAAVSLFILIDKPIEVPRWATLILVGTLAVGAGSCAAEDRVCEAAGLETDQ